MQYGAFFSSVPYQNLQNEIRRLNLTETDLAAIHDHSSIFIANQYAFAEFFYNFFYQIQETRMVIERFGKADVMKQTWATWFERLFTEKLDTNFINYIWRIGLRHVEINLDQRFSNLGFSLVRQFCQRIALENMSPTDAGEILPIIDKMIDFCILVETNAYIETTIRCDIEILKGIADKIRNPVTIIGGNLRRLQRHVDPQDPLFQDYNFLISSTRHCEDMIEDINTYMEIFQRRVKIEQCMLDTIIDNTLEKLSVQKRLDGINVEVHLDPSARFVQGDPIDLRHLFYELVENAAEGSRSASGPYVRISSPPQGGYSDTVRIEIFNNGDVLNLANISNIVTPFYSTKAQGSGLGLSIVNIAIRKNYGELNFEPVPQEGTKVYVTLQKADQTKG